MKKIILFENFGTPSLDVYYEIRYIDENGDVENFVSGNDDYDVNPFDLVEVVKYMMKYEDEYPNLFIVKITEEDVSDEDLKKAKMVIDTKKYNL